MLKQLSRTTQIRTCLARGPATLCVGLVSLWLAAGCDLTAQRIPPTPPTAETPPTAPDDRTTAPTRTSTVPAEPPTSETTQAPRFQYDPDTFALIPWAPIEAPPGAWERTQKIVEPLYQQYRAGQMSQEEYDEKNSSDKRGCFINRHPVPVGRGSVPRPTMKRSFLPPRPR